MKDPLKDDVQILKPSDWMNRDRNRRRNMDQDNDTLEKRTQLLLLCSAYSLLVQVTYMRAKKAEGPLCLSSILHSQFFPR